MKVLYLIQTHRNPEQIHRLVQTMKKSSPDSCILISHNFTSSYLDVAHLQNLSKEVVVISGKGGRGNFSLMQGYLDAVDWLFSHNTKFDWLINITGQDYPTQSGYQPKAGQWYQDRRGEEKPPCESRLTSRQPESEARNEVTPTCPASF